MCRMTQNCDPQLGQGFPKKTIIRAKFRAKFIIYNFLQLNFNFYPDLGKFNL